MNVTAADLVEQIRTGPSGARVGAFFDLDGTLVRGYTAAAALQERIRRGQAGPRDLARLLLAAADGGREALGRTGFAQLRGHTVDELTALAGRLFTEKVAGTIRPDARELIRAHRRQGHTVVVASSASRMQVEPIAEDLGIRHILCTELEEHEGVLTGRSTGGMLWGEAKARAVREFARASRISLRRSYGYADGAEDVAFLGAVGRPYAVNPHPSLHQAADRHGWPVLELREPASPGPWAYLGTLGALLSVDTGLSLGMAYGWLTGDHRRGANLGIGLAADTGLAFAGVKVNVTGAQNLEKARPAVFVANHQSTLDALVLAALLRHDFTAVAKQEARFDPRMALIGTFLDPVWIDRSDPQRARQSMSRAVRRIRDGESVLVLPEGTRMPTPRPGRFKKGAFHLAAQAGVPIVPIVLRNTGELAWRRSLVVSPGTVDVAVLDPIPTGGWTTDDLNAQVAELHDRFAAVLENWPSASASAPTLSAVPS
ncbi:HAD-IB family hydrolase [Actinoplanes sp. L3-i22]|uniref:HAD-IB family hydrolase n=1 Tax=Actinoplanes sp. L3-i22 TaxID=2836373 RepID=UPI001C76CEDF|nr:HAD-IB family hydrolase [Actinoplanes sp. L3-i22]BCY09399.1 acyltransferase [Actinoplanes sp. L3-i22]